MKKKTQGIILLLIAAFIWGTAFAAQKVGMEALPPLTFNGTRMLVGCIVTYITYRISCMLNPEAGKRAAEEAMQRYRKDTGRRGDPLIIAGVTCGVCLVVASAVQQVGLLYTTAGKAGFITTLYIIFVPLIGMLSGKRPPWMIWVCVLVAVAGFYLMCIKEGFSLGKGDLLILICAVAFAMHIILVDRYISYVNGIMLSCSQFIVCGIISMILGVIFERDALSFQAFKEALPALMYTGVLSSGVAYTFQILGQKRLESSLASLIMSLESVFALVGGFLVFGEVPSVREGIGCIMVFVAVIIAQRV